MTILYTHPIFLKHETGIHPENPDRLRAITARLDSAGLLDRCKKGECRAIAEPDVLAIHSPDMLAQARNTSSQGGGFLDPDTVVSPESYQVALTAAGTAVAAVDAIVQGVDERALCLVRPPGHHATSNRSMGFCLFNNIALAVQHARAKHGLARILIVDWDVHHGNGTQDIFYADPAVFFFSIHRYGHGFYPGTGDASETGTGPGLGRTLNEPIRYGKPRSEYLDRFRLALERAADQARPELIFLSAGFDAHARDPIGSLGLEVEDFATMTALVRDVARVHCQGRLVSLLEGGYHLDALAESVQVHLEGLRSL
jgi:acetoin utilization deacetylase AcuC-like enzyme